MTNTTYTLNPALTFDIYDGFRKGDTLKVTNQLTKTVGDTKVTTHWELSNENQSRFYDVSTLSILIGEIFTEIKTK